MNWFPTTGLGEKGTRYKITGTRASGGLCSGVSSAAGPKPPVPRRLRPPTSHQVFLKWGTARAAQQRSVWPAEGAALRGGRWSRSHGSSRGHEAQGRALRPGVQPRASRARAAGGYRGRPPGGARGVGGRAQAAAGAGSPGPSSFRASSRAPRRAPASGQPPRRRGAGAAPLTGKRPNRSAQEPAQSPGASAPRGTWPGEGSPVRDRACAVARARPSAGKEHAQCEGTLGYVGAQGMLAESRDPAHAQKRPEPATHWWREKREKSPQSYVRKGRVLRGGCGLPRGPAVLLGRGA